MQVMEGMADAFIAHECPDGSSCLITFATPEDTVVLIEDALEAVRAAAPLHYQVSIIA